uniref:Myosin motor domain-containing protein n=1 Tax=Megaselia scalaris TaxID=36166 RepID=T1GTH2_MEGSC
MKTDFRGVADFAIVHYAGRVDYSAAKWLMKNMDPLNENVVSLLQASQDPFVVNIWKDAEIVGMFRTVSHLYKEQLAKLMDTLRNTNPNFVRCIIPNHEKRAGKIDAPLVLDQLRCNGVLEGIRICRQGFPNRIPFQEFRQRYELLTPNVIPKGFMDGKKACERMIQALELDSNLYRVGQSKIFFRAGVLAHLEEERDYKITDLIVNFQAFCRGFLARRNYQKRLQQLNAIRIIQRNCAAYLKLKNWQWWRLYTKVKPLLEVTKQEEKLVQKEDELKQVREKLEVLAKSTQEYEKKYQVAMDEKTALAEQLQAEIELCAEAEESRSRLMARKQELEDMMQELEARIEEEEEHALKHSKRLQAQVKEALREAEDAKAAKEELSALSKEAERKVKTLEAEVLQLTEDLASSERARRAAETERDELAEEISSNANKGSLMIDEKRRLEARITTLEEELEEEQSNSEILLDRTRKSQLAIEQLTTELATEKSNSQKSENARLLLERQNKELKAKLAEIETAQRTKIKATISALESKI